MEVKKLLIFIVFPIAGCNGDSKLQNSFKVMMDVRAEFDINAVEMKWHQDTTFILLNDLKYTNYSIEQLKNEASLINNYLSEKYQMIDTINNRKYRFQHTGIDKADIYFNRKRELLRAKEF